MPLEGSDVSKRSVEHCDSVASTRAQEVLPVETEVTNGEILPEGLSNTTLEKVDNGDIALVVQDIDDKGKQLETEDACVTSSNRRVVVLAMAWYVLMTLLYFVYRSQEKSIFTPEAFQLRWHDLVGVLFLLSFLLLRKPSYLVYAINPFRNVVLVAFQLFFPRLRDPETNPEYYRNILSASIQLCTATAIWWCTTPQPIGSGTCWKAEMPCLEKSRRSCLKKWLKRFVNLLLVTTGVAAVAIALEKQTDHFRTLHTEDHGWKIIFSVLLGMAEEVTWRTVYMADNNNSIQALTWGINHIVAGTGMKNPWLYGLVSGSYAFCLGVTPYVTLRSFHHSAVEYFVIDNLVKPEGHPIWLTQSV